MTKYMRSEIREKIDAIYTALEEIALEVEKSGHGSIAINVSGGVWELNKDDRETAIKNAKEGVRSMQTLSEVMALGGSIY